MHGWIVQNSFDMVYARGGVKLQNLVVHYKDVIQNRMLYQGGGVQNKSEIQN